MRYSHCFVMFLGLCVFIKGVSGACDEGCANRSCYKRAPGECERIRTGSGANSLNSTMCYISWHNPTKLEPHPGPGQSQICMVITPPVEVYRWDCLSCDPDCSKEDCGAESCEECSPPDVSIDKNECKIVPGDGSGV